MKYLLTWTPISDGIRTPRDISEIWLGLEGLNFSISFLDLEKCLSKKGGERSKVRLQNLWQSNWGDKHFTEGLDLRLDGAWAGGEADLAPDFVSTSQRSLPRIIRPKNSRPISITLSLGWDGINITGVVWATGSDLDHIYSCSTTWSSTRSSSASSSSLTLIEDKVAWV